jgi:hypothetical protein
MSVTSELTPEAMAVYRATARRRWEADQREELYGIPWWWLVGFSDV